MKNKIDYVIIKKTIEGVRMNQKGHALVEFVIILPLLLFLMIGFFDFLHIKETEKKLEKEINELNISWNEMNQFDEINQMVKEKNKDAILEITNKNDEYRIISIKENLKIYCPLLNRILKSPYEIKVEKKLEKEG